MSDCVFLLYNLNGINTPGLIQFKVERDILCKSVDCMWYYLNRCQNERKCVII